MCDHGSSHRHMSFAVFLLIWFDIPQVMVMALGWEVVGTVHLALEGGEQAGSSCAK